MRTLLACVVFAFLAGCLSSENPYGKGLEKACYKSDCLYVLDFNLDNASDTLVAYRASENTQLPESVRLVSLGSARDSFVPKQQVVFGVQLSGAISAEEKDLYLLHNRRLLSTPMWMEGELPAEVVPAEGISEIEGGGALSIRAVGDVLAIGTEAGIDIYVYFDGNTFSLFEPYVVP